MAAGFASPGILFLNTWDAPERAFVRAASIACREHGGYKRVVETCAGSLVMPAVHVVQGGWKPEQIEASDVALFTAVVGNVVMDTRLKHLDVRIDGKPVEMGEDSVSDGALVLYWQLVARMEARPDNDYWHEIRVDLQQRADEHRDGIAKYLRLLQERFEGMTFYSMDMWEHMDCVKDDPKILITVNAPTYLGGFERFYNTNGRLTWNEPKYEMFDPATGQKRMFEESKSWKALLISQEQVTPGEGVENVIYARDLAAGQVIHAWSNRPDELRSLMSAVGRKLADHTPLKYGCIRYKDEINNAVQVEVGQITDAEARYYRDLWIHRIATARAVYNFAVYVDGKVAGIGGLDNGPIDRPKNPKHGTRWDNAVLLTYAVGAPHETYRLTRLVTMIGCTRCLIESLMTPWTAVRAEQVVTAEFTRYAEAKGLRGIMKLATRTVDPKRGPKLTYATDLNDSMYQEVFTKWHRKEAQWRKARVVISTS